MKDIPVFALVQSNWQGSRYIFHSTYELCGQGFGFEEAAKDLKRSLGSYLEWYVRKSISLPVPHLSEGDLLEKWLGDIKSVGFLTRIGQDTCLWSDLGVCVEIEYYRLV